MQYINTASAPTGMESTALRFIVEPDNGRSSIGTGELSQVARSGERQDPAQALQPADRAGVFRLDAALHPLS